MMKIALSLGLLLAERAAAFAPSRLAVDFGRGLSSPAFKPAAAPVLQFKDAVVPSRTQLYMGWGPEPVWSTGTVDSNIQACPSGSCVTLRIKVDDGSGFIYPGQYVQVKPAGDADAKPAFLAIASAPSGEAPKPEVPGKKKKKTDVEEEPAYPSAEPATWEFLIKKTDNNGWITDAQAGSVVDVSQVMGGGFPMQENLEGFKYDFPTQNVMLFATGSGIAPIKSAIESGQLEISGGRTCTLYYGVRTPDDMPFVAKFGDWEDAGVQVVPVVSQPDLPCESGAVWKGRTGYVQNALEEDGVAIPRNSGALLCGVKGMAESVTSMLTQSGVFEGRILTNF